MARTSSAGRPGIRCNRSRRVSTVRGNSDRDHSAVEQAARNTGFLTITRSVVMRLFTIAVLALGVGLVAWADEPKKDAAPEPDKKVQDKAPEKIPEPKIPG